MHVCFYLNKMEAVYRYRRAVCECVWRSWLPFATSEIYKSSSSAWLGLSRLVLAFVFAMIISAVSVLYKTSAVAILIWWPSFFSYFLVLCNQIRTGSRAEGRDRRGRGSWERDVCRVRNANWNWHFGQWPTKCFSELMAHKHTHS